MKREKIHPSEISRLEERIIDSAGIFVFIELNESFNYVKSFTEDWLGEEIAHFKRIGINSFFYGNFLAEANELIKSCFESGESPENTLRMFFNKERIQEGIMSRWVKRYNTKTKAWEIYTEGNEKHYAKCGERTILE